MVNVSSSACIMAFPQVFVYSASKVRHARGSGGLIQLHMHCIYILVGRSVGRSVGLSVIDINVEIPPS